MKLRYKLCPKCPKEGSKKTCPGCGLTSGGRRMARRLLMLRDLGFKREIIKIELSPAIGVLSFSVPGHKKSGCAYTIPDLVPGVNVDVGEDGSIVGIEDLRSLDIEKLVMGWFEAAAKARKKLARKAARKAKKAKGTA